MANANLIAITGNTYPVKEQLKALGATWNAPAKAWMVAADRAEEARGIVSSAGPARSSRGSSSYSGGGYSRRYSGGRRYQSSYSGGHCGCEDFPCCGH